MKLKALIYTGAAVVGFAVTPAFAFTHHPGTPAEHQQTDDLNQQQLQQTQTGSQSTMSTDQNAAGASQMSSSAAGDTTAAPASNTAQANMPAATQTANAMPLDSIANSPQALANASVETSNGQAVGAVQRVITDTAGKAKTVVVALLGKASRVVAIAANQLTFDQSRNVVIAQLSADQIENLPMAPQS